jgi:hypothetical protein
MQTIEHNFTALRLIPPVLKQISTIQASDSVDKSPNSHITSRYIFNSFDLTWPSRRANGDGFSVPDSVFTVDFRVYKGDFLGKILNGQYLKYMSLNRIVESIELF